MKYTLLRLICTLLLSIMTVATIEAALPHPNVEVANEQEFQQLRSAGIATQVILADFSRNPNRRVPAVVTAILHVAAKNPNADLEKISLFVNNYDDALRNPAESTLADARDPDLMLPVNFLTRVPFGTRLSKQAGLNTDVGFDVLRTLGLQDEDRPQQEYQLAEFVGNQGFDLVNGDELPAVLTYAFLSLDSNGNYNPIVRHAVVSYLRSNGFEPFPAQSVINSDYSFINDALSGAPEDYQQLKLARQENFSNVKQKVYQKIDLLLQKMDQDIQHLVTIDQRQRADYLNAFISPPPADVTAAQARRLADIEYFNSLRAQINLPLSIADVAGEPDVASDVAKGAAAAKTIAEGLSFMAAAYEDSKASNLLRGGGGLFSIVTTVAALVDDSPTVEEQILGQILEMRQQIDNLRTEMNARFDAIDGSLDAIYALLGNTQQDISDIQGDLHRLSSNLSKLQQNLFGALQDGFQQDLVVGINNGIGHRKRTGFDLPYLGAESFNSFENLFYTNAVNTAEGVLYAGPTDGQPVGLSFLNAAETLPNDNYSYNINSLRRFPADPGVGFLPNPLYPVRTVSPTVWSVSANAYAQLARENPWYFASFKQNDPARIQSIIQKGSQAQSAMQNMSNQELLEELIAHHQGQQAALDSALDDRLAAFLLQQNPQIPLFNPWGGNWQTLTGYNLPTLSLPRCDSPSTTWTGVNINSWMDSYWKLGHYLGVSPLTMCITPWWSGRRYTSGWAPGVWWYNYYAKPAVDVTVKWGNHNIKVYRAIGSEEFIATRFYVTDVTNPSNWDDGWEIVKNNWTGGQNLRSKLYSVITHNPTAYNSLQNQLDIRTNQVRSGFYTAVLQDLQGSGNIADRAKEISGAAALLEGYLSLSMPESVIGNDVLAAFFKGNKLRLDTSAVQDYYINAQLNNPNVKPTVQQLMSPRINGLETIINLLKQGNQGLPEYHPYLRWSLANLADVNSITTNLAKDDIYVFPSGSPQNVSNLQGVLANDAKAPQVAPPQVGYQVRAVFDHQSQPGGVRLTERGGTITLNADGLGGFLYNPPPGFTGEDSFTYFARGDVEGTSSSPVFSNQAKVIVYVMAPMDDVKMLQDNYPTSFSGVITGVYNDYLYIQDTDNYSGIRVSTTQIPLDRKLFLIPGLHANVTGITSTNSHGERQVLAATISVAGPGSVKPVSMVTKSLGGSDSNHDFQSGSGQAGMTFLKGTNNIGLLVRIAGTVTNVDPFEDYIVVSDGSNQADNNRLIDPEAYDGVRVKLPANSPEIEVGDVVEVTGNSSCFVYEGNRYPIVLISTVENLQIQE